MTQASFPWDKHTRWFATVQTQWAILTKKPLLSISKQFHLDDTSKSEKRDRGENWMSKNTKTQPELKKTSSPSVHNMIEYAYHHS